MADNPVSLRATPFDGDAFATEVSPNRATQGDRNAAVIADVRAAARLRNGRVVLVGHSLGGRTISPVAEAVPYEVGAVVYLAAVLHPGDRKPPPQTPNRDMQSLFVDDFRAIGLVRMNVNTDDPVTLATVRQVFYNDLSNQQFATAVDHC